MEADKIDTSPLDRLNTRQVPVLPPGAPYLIQAMTDDSINFRQLAEIVERFPSIAARLIALANSVWSSPVSPIASLDVACSRLGFSVVRSTSIALAVASPFDPTKCLAFNAEIFWCHSLLVADVSTWLAQATPDQDNLPPQTARAAGLLHNLGLLWLVDQLPEESNQAILLSQNDPVLTLDQAFLEIVGIDYCEVGRFLGEAWNLPEPLVLAMSHKAAKINITPYWEAALLVDLADSLVTALENDIPYSASDTRLKALGIKQADTDHVIQQLNRQIEVTRELAHTLFRHASGA